MKNHFTNCPHYKWIDATNNWGGEDPANFINEDFALHLITRILKKIMMVGVK